uniref:Uncharacterized protein n=1 Tax=Anguilla anguilla TaxID=7936 RepID=A0A0E9WQD9_ANGAN
MKHLIHFERAELLCSQITVKQMFVITSAAACPWHGGMAFEVLIKGHRFIAHRTLYLCSESQFFQLLTNNLTTVFSIHIYLSIKIFKYFCCCCCCCCYYY